MNIVAWILFVFLVGYVFYAVEETVKEARKPKGNIGQTARISIGLLALLAAFLLVVDQSGAKNINSLQKTNVDLRNRISQGFVQRIQVAPLHMAQCKDLSYTALEGSDKFCSTRGGILRANP